MISERLEKLVEEMVDKGVRFEDAIREFEKRFINRVLVRSDGSLTKTAIATRSAARWGNTRSNAFFSTPPLTLPIAAI
jgi:hypothetical protein